MVTGLWFHRWLLVAGYCLVCEWCNTLPLFLLKLPLGQSLGLKSNATVLHYMFFYDYMSSGELNIVLFLPDTIPIGNTIPTSVLMVYLQPEMINIFRIPTLKTTKPLGHLLGTVAVVKQLL